MKFLFLLPALALFCSAGYAFDQVQAKHWVCMAKSDNGTHPATVVWGESSSSRAKAGQSALDKCEREAVNPGNCRVTDCWID